MSLSQQQILSSLAMGQMMMVVPELGESYVGKSASTLGLLALMLAGQQDRMMQAGPKMRARLEGLLSSAATADAGLQAEIAAALADDCGGSWTARQDRLMGALESLHAFADSRDPALAAQCRGFLVELAEAEQMEIPALPG